MKIIAYLIVYLILAYIFTEWNILIGKTYKKMVQDPKTNRESTWFLIVWSTHFALWPVTTLLDWSPRIRRLWERKENFYKIGMTIIGSLFKIIWNLIAISLIIIGTCIYILFFTKYIPNTKNESS